MNDHRLKLETYEWLDEMLRIGSRAVQKAQEESRRMGVPNVYSINGFLYYELPSGELSRTDPYQPPQDKYATASEKAETKSNGGGCR